MPRTHEQVPLDVAVADQAAIVRAVIIDDHELARVEPRHGYRPRAVTGGNHVAERNEADLVQLWPAIVRVITQHVEHLGMDRGHEPKLRTRSDSHADEVRGQ